MAARGRKPSVPNEFKIQILKEFKILREDGTVAEDEEQLKNACSKINEELKPVPKMTLKNLCMFAQRQKKVLEPAIDKCGEVTQKAHSRSESKIHSTESKLLELQNNVLYKGIIREVATHPVTVFHWSIEVIDHASNLPCHVTYTFGVIGSLCKNVVAPDNSVSNQIYLYALGVAMHGDFLPVCQMSTEDFSTSLFRRFFGESLRSNLGVPSTLTLDHFYNHLVAANSVFNINYQYEDYLMICFKNLLGESENQPRCYIFTNVRFLLLKIQMTESFAKIRLPAVKIFYLWCIILLSKQTNFSNFQKVLKKIFVIAFCKYELSIFTTSFEEITQEIQLLKINETYNQEYFQKLQASYGCLLKCESVPKINYQICQDILEIILAVFIEARSMIRNCTSSENTSEKHAYTNELFCKELIKLCTEFPVWTDIIKSAVNGTTKTDPEFECLLENYKDKFLQFSNDDANVPMDEYLLKNIIFVDTQLSEQRLSQKSSNGTVKKIDDIERSLNALEENWKGKNPVAEQLDDHSNNDSSDSDLDISECDQSHHSMIEFADKSIHEIVEAMCNKLDKSKSMNNDVDGTLLQTCIPIINKRNIDRIVNEPTGNHSEEIVLTRPKGKYLRADPEFDIPEQRRTKYPKKRVIIQNIIYNKPRKLLKIPQIFITSAHFDSILEILASAYYHFKTFQDYVENKKKDILQQSILQFLNCLYTYTSNLNMNTLNSERVKLLTSIYTRNQNGKWNWIEGLGYLFAKLMPPNVIVKLSCLSCAGVTYEHHTQIVMTAQEANLENIDSVVKERLTTKRTCDCTGVLISDQFQIEKVLCLNVEDTTLDNRECLCVLRNLRVQQHISDKKFLLSGIIAFKEGIVRGDPRHYIAYSRTPVDRSWVWMQFDNANRTGTPKRVRATEVVNIALLIYVEAQSDDNGHGRVSPSEICSEVLHSPVIDQNTGTLGLNLSIDDEATFGEQIKTSTPTHSREKDSDTYSNQTTDIVEYNAQRTKAIDAILNAPVVPYEESYSEVSAEESDKRAAESTWSWDDSISVHERELVQNGSIIGQNMYTLNENKEGFGLITEYVLRKCAFKHTSSFDSCLEVIVDMYLEHQDLKSDVDDVHRRDGNDFFALVQSYCKNFNLTHLYDNRVSYLYPFVKNRKDELDMQKSQLSFNCNVPITEEFERCMKHYPSFIERIKCSHDYCIKGSDSTAKVSVSPSVEQFHIVGIEKLQLFVDDIFRDREPTSCSHCSTFQIHNSVKTTWLFNEYFALNVEYLSEKKNLPLFTADPDLKHFPFKFKTNFNKIPGDVNVRGEHFYLKSVVCFSGDADREVEYSKKNEPSPKHYFSYSLDQESNKWVEYNDLREDIIVLDKAPVEKIALIVYLKKVNE